MPSGVWTYDDSLGRAADPTTLLLFSANQISNRGAYQPRSLFAPIQIITPAENVRLCPADGQRRRYVLSFREAITSQPGSASQPEEWLDLVPDRSDANSQYQRLIILKYKAMPFLARLCLRRVACCTMADEID